MMEPPMLLLTEPSEDDQSASLDSEMASAFLKKRWGRSGSWADLEQSTIDTSAKEACYSNTIHKLDYYYGIVKRQLLKYQSPTLGLFPSLSNDGQRGHIRDSIYCSWAIWSLYQAYRRIDDDRGKAYELGQSAVKCMRGILVCWLRQADKIQQFKNNQNPKFALHTIFNLVTNEPFSGEEEYDHLQIDVPSLYLMFLVQMISSGLQVIYTMDEVNFVQNLVYYVERAYRIPDYGMWERGAKNSNLTPELHASSIGMAKSALEAINGCNLFGDKGASWSVIYVDIDAHNRNRSIFETLLPRESSSKNTDISLLPCISFPCFATHDERLYNKTKEKIVRKLKGEYGFKRFLRDGYGTVTEDFLPKKNHGKSEVKKYDNIESEWPLFYIFMIIDGVFKSNKEQVDTYQKLIQSRILRDKQNDSLVPKYFYVPKHSVDAEKNHPGSQLRLPSREGEPGCLFLWGQAMYVISQLLVDNLLHVNELDPIRRYLPSYSRPRKSGRYSAFQGSVLGAASDLVVQVVLIAESMRLQAMMATYGIQTQTPHEVEPVQIWSPSELVKVYEYLGVNKKLHLQGRPSRPIGTLGTSKVYRICGQTILCYPLIFQVSDFYLSHDMALLIDDIKTDLQFVGKYWRLSGRPTVCLLIREDHMRDVHFKEMLDLLAMLKTGRCNGTKVRIGRLQNLLSTSCIEHLDFMHMVLDDNLKFESFTQLVHISAGYQSLTDIRKAISVAEEMQDYKGYKEKSTWDLVDEFRNSNGLYHRSFILSILLGREGNQFQVGDRSIREHLEIINNQACTSRNWSVVRFCSSLLQKLVDSISPFTTSILVNGKQVTVGVNGHEEALIDKPMSPAELKHIIYSKIMPYDPFQPVIQQEILLYVGKLISTNRSAFDGILKIRVGCIVHAMLLYMDSFYQDPRALDTFSPSDLRKLINRVFNLGDTTPGFRHMSHRQRRQIEGSLNRVPKTFYENVWNILRKTPAGIRIGETFLPQHPTLSDMTLQELNFSLLIEGMVSQIKDPEYRAVVVEVIMVISTILQRNPEFIFEEELNLNQLIAEANAIFVQETNGANNMNAFYDSSPNLTYRYLARAAANHVLKTHRTMENGDFCKVS